VSDDSTETEIEATAEEADAPAAEEAPAAEVEAAAEEAVDVVAAEEAEGELPEVAGEGAEADTAAETYEAPVAVATQEGPAVARVYICKHGHRTISLWSVPETCLRRVKGHICGETVVPLADAPADAKEKMLNPLKASKKAAKKS
jgi:hypothetical protein